jgi:hypothetical protein
MEADLDGILNPPRLPAHPAKELLRRFQTLKVNVVVAPFAGPVRESRVRLYWFTNFRAPIAPQMSGNRSLSFISLATVPETIWTDEAFRARAGTTYVLNAWSLT